MAWRTTRRFSTRRKILISTQVLAILGLDVVVAIALLARLAENAFVAERLTFDLFVADVALHVAVAGRARGLLNPRAAVLILLPLASLWMTPLAARIHIVGGDAAQHRDRQCVPQSMRGGHR